MNLYPLTLFSFSLFQPSGIPAKPFKTTSALFGCSSQRHQHTYTPEGRRKQQILTTMAPVLSPPVSHLKSSTRTCRLPLGIRDAINIDDLRSVARRSVRDVFVQDEEKRAPGDEGLRPERLRVRERDRVEDVLEGCPSGDRLRFDEDLLGRKGTVDDVCRPQLLEQRCDVRRGGSDDGQVVGEPRH